MMRSVRTAAVAGFACLALVAALPSTSASFTATTVVEGHTAATGTLEPSVLSEGETTAGSAELTWDAAPAGGLTPAYTLTRTGPGATDPVEVYAGTETAVIDRGEIPAALSDREITGVSVGIFRSVAVDAQGGVWAWGLGGIAGLGDEDITQSARTPIRVSFPDDTRIVEVSVGGSHTLALDDEGGLWVWGRNGAGQLGTGDEETRHTPVSVSLRSAERITAIGAGTDHSVVLTADGNVWAWGDNGSGQVGRGGSTTGTSTPVWVIAFSGITITDIAVGSAHSMALTADGMLWAWGDNTWGQVGVGRGNTISIPTPVVTLISVTITDIAAGGNHSLALAADGGLWAWGYNSNGQLGTGSDAFSEEDPAPVSSLAGVDIAELAPGTTYTLATTDEGVVWGWGANDTGQLGTGQAGPNERTPVPIPPLAGESVAALAAGSLHSVALAADGRLLAWGHNGEGQLGTGAGFGITATPTPVDFPEQPICPTGSELLDGEAQCTLVEGTSYTYTLTSRIGWWDAVSAPLTITTEAP